MQISNENVDDAALKAVGCDAVSLLCSGDITTLASRFGYATAIQEDLAECLEQIGASGLACELELAVPSSLEAKLFWLIERAVICCR